MASIPTRKRDTSQVGYIAVSRRADPLQLHLSDLHTPAGITLTALGHSTLDPLVHQA